jgi:hypothetical protein
MYRVGFGDFFLLSLLQAAGEPLHIIVDCGVFKGTSQTGDIGSIEAAVTDMIETTRGKVALIIMTHRHADHIAGFARCAAAFKKLQVGGVWMPIWESEYSPAAIKFQAMLTRTALGLQQHFANFGAGATEEQQTARKYMENAVGETAANGGGTNAAALTLLKQGFPGIAPHYYQGGDPAELPDALAKAGLTAQILGPPPVTDLALMKLMDLQKGVGQYVANVAERNGESFAPFGQHWEIEPLTAKERDGVDLSPVALREWVKPRKSWGEVSIQAARKAQAIFESTLKESQPIAALTAAKQLNSLLNNQSLVVLFTFKDKKLLFVGDAQAGNWEHWLFKTDDPDKKGTGTLNVDAQQILTGIDFYKVGHHGSGNATPKVVVDAMNLHTHSFASMCSTQKDVYGTEDPDDPTKGTEVPRIPLLEQLAKESALVRSDQVDIVVDGKVIAAKAPANLPPAGPGHRFVKGVLWVDCYL